MVTVLGPRQSAKTTLVRSTSPDCTYVSLEEPEIRQLAYDDPKAFLQRFPAPAIYAEIQRAPQLLSYLHGQVDCSPLDAAVFREFWQVRDQSPKYYFIELGLLTYLLDIEKPEQIERDPLMGAMFENLVVIEALKARLNRGLSPNLYFFCDSQGKELDLRYTAGPHLSGIEIKASSTWHSSFREGLDHFAESVHPLLHKSVGYNGSVFLLSDALAPSYVVNVPRLLAGA
ncbi:MAG: ATP-binding protein [Dechloromonas sp.]|nr:MAG: ATP-binding protein [Dechloromonas sp.]